MPAAVPRAGAAVGGPRRRGAVSGGQRRSGGLGRAPAMGSRVEHARAGHLPRALSGRSPRLPVVRRGLRRSGRRGLAGDGRSPAAALRDLEAGVRALRPVLLRAAAHAGELHQRPFLRRLRAVRGGAEDHDAMAAGAGGRPARVHAARQRREPDRLHVRRRRGRRVAARWCRRAGTSATVDFASGTPVSVNDVVAGDGAVARRRRHRSRIRARPRSTSSFTRSTARCATGSASRRRSRSTTGLRRLAEFFEQESACDPPPST